MVRAVCEYAGDEWIERMDGWRDAETRVVGIAKCGQDMNGRENAAKSAAEMVYTIQYSLQELRTHHFHGPAAVFFSVTQTKKRKNVKAKS